MNWVKRLVNIAILSLILTLQQLGTLPWDVLRFDAINFLVSKSVIISFFKVTHYRGKKDYLLVIKFINFKFKMFYIKNSLFNNQI